ncbi:TRAP transporter substrate-binding protein [Alkalihalobacillus sp. BA299]|uniref:TRAP transporter substrate-binding protein n=1 Tax=Alkalihalobacillus sp. BA299 TaxID=2815938 RepID=UPI001FFE150A|nr:TRAP transporter substrate-binding protein [Alkalihalobacillus sp. BA299]
MKKQLLLLVTAALILVALAGCGTAGGGAGGNDNVEIVLSHTAAPGTPIYLTYEKFKEEVEERSEGAVTVRIHHSATLAGDTQGIEMLKNNTLDIASAATNNMAPFTDLFLPFDLPYLFEDVYATHKVLSGEIGQEYKDMTREDLDLELLFYLDPGTQRHVMNTERQVKVPEDLNGLRFRSAESPIEMAYVESLGATATPITWVEVYSALEQGVVDGLVQQPHWAVTANLHEVIRYVTETGGIHALHIAFMNKETFDGLTEEQQQIVLDAASAAQEYNFEQAPEFADELKQEMIDEGVEFYTPTEEEQQLWVETSVKIWDQFAEEVDQDLIERIQAAQQ